MNNNSNFENNSKLGYYLTGLIEGDGNIWTQKTIRSPKGCIINPRISFSFNRKEKPLYKHINKVLGGGYINDIKLTNASVYTIADKFTLIKLINLINGKFRTPKIIYLHKAIDYLNTVHNTNIDKLPLFNGTLCDNPWLTGMIDSDGSFFINLNGKYKFNDIDTKGRVKIHFSLSQRKIDKLLNITCVPFMTDVATFFKTNLYFVKNRNIISVSVLANNKHYIVKYYFDKFPLMSSKYLDYLCYEQGLNYLGKQLKHNEITEIRNIKESMNNNRTYFNWNHLDNFYQY